MKCIGALVAEPRKKVKLPPVLAHRVHKKQVPHSWPKNNKQSCSVQKVRNRQKTTTKGRSACFSAPFVPFVPLVPLVPLVCSWPNKQNKALKQTPARLRGACQAHGHLDLRQQAAPGGAPVERHVGAGDPQGTRAERRGRFSPRLRVFSLALLVSVVLWLYFLVGSVNFLVVSLALYFGCFCLRLFFSLGSIPYTSMFLAEAGAIFKPSRWRGLENEWREYI